MRSLPYALSILLILLAGSPWASAGDRLIRIRNALFDGDRVPGTVAPMPSPIPVPPPKRKEYDPEVTYNLGEIESETVLGLAILSSIVVGAAVSSPYWAPRIWLADDGTSRAIFPHFPYEGAHRGYLIEHTKKAEDQLPTTKNFGLQGRGFWAHADDMNRYGGNLTFMSQSRFGLTANWLTLAESNAERVDTMSLSDVNVIYRFAQNERSMMRMGIGLRTLYVDEDTYWGVNATYGGDFFVAKPIVVSTTIDLGNVREAFLFRARATGGIVWRHGEIFAGWDYLRIGDVNIHGPSVGLRIWF
jgi:hypothetical protein